MQFCPGCGEKLPITAENASQPTPQYAPPQYQPQSMPPNQYNNAAASYGIKPRKDKIVAGILGIVLGGIGVHKFYLGEIGVGLLYLIFCWTGIPAVIGLIEGIIYLTTPDEVFQQKYVKAV
jgi:TM2 domain-containing membrane protein YozV